MDNVLMMYTIVKKCMHNVCKCEYNVKIMWR